MQRIRELGIDAFSHLLSATLFMKNRNFIWKVWKYSHFTLLLLILYIYIFMCVLNGIYSIGVFCQNIIIEGEPHKHLTPHSPDLLTHSLIQSVIISTCDSGLFPQLFLFFWGGGQKLSLPFMQAIFKIERRGGRNGQETSIVKLTYSRHNRIGVYFFIILHSPDSSLSHILDFVCSWISAPHPQTWWTDSGGGAWKD